MKKYITELYYYILSTKRLRNNIDILKTTESKEFTTFIDGLSKEENLLHVFKTLSIRVDLENEEFVGVLKLPTEIVTDPKSHTDIKLAMAEQYAYDKLMKLEHTIELSSMLDLVVLRSSSSKKGDAFVQIVIEPASRDARFQTEDVLEEHLLVWKPKMWKLFFKAVGISSILIFTLFQIYLRMS